jgi:hypothetical protein
LKKYPNHWAGYNLEQIKSEYEKLQSSKKITMWWKNIIYINCFISASCKTNQKHRSYKISNIDTVATGEFLHINMVSLKKSNLFKINGIVCSWEQTDTLKKGQWT